MAGSKGGLASDDECPHCGAHLPNMLINVHVGHHHPEIIDAAIQQMRSEKRELSNRVDEAKERKDALDEDSSDDAAGLDAEGPVSYDDVPREQPGQRLGPSYNDPRECNTCGTRVSKSYSRQWSLPDGTIYCPNCETRGQRYTNDPLTGGDT